MSKKEKEVKKPKVIKEEKPKVVKKEEVKVEEAPKEEYKVPVQPRICEFEDTYIVNKLDSGHNATHYHCYCEDGSTRHVPRELIDNQ